MILYKFASRSRPLKFFNCVENIYINSRTPDFYIMATLDIDDPSMNNEDVINKMKAYDKLYPIFGTSLSKIDAINRDMDKAPDFDILINMSDDMMFNYEGFDVEIIKDFGGNYDQCLHYPDGNRNDLITMAIIGKDYYKRFGYIYHPDYKSLWCDNEATDVAKILNCYKYVDKNLFRHFHPAYDPSLWDNQYRITEGYSEQDQATYNRRKLNAFVN